MIMTTMMMMTLMVTLLMDTNPGTTLTTPGGKPASFTSWATARPLRDVVMIIIVMIIIVMIIIIVMMIIAQLF